MIGPAAGLILDGVGIRVAPFQIRGRGAVGKLRPGTEKIVRIGVRPEEQILPEDRSTTTAENLLFSRRLIEQRCDSPRVAFSTSSYHVYRGGILAAESGWNVDGMGSHTKWYFWPNAFLREFIGLLVSSRVQQLTAILVIAVLSAGLTAIVM